MYDPIPGSEIRHNTFQEMLQDDEIPEPLTDYEIEMWEQICNGDDHHE